MTFNEDRLLQLSGIQHFAFCRRQWALIHVERQWAENYLTADGRIMHENAHDTGKKESRGEIKITRGLYVRSYTLGISGQCDVVEFHRTEAGIMISGWDGKWRPFPVEYKRGRPKSGKEDELQLCAQAMCLEQMLCCDIPKGALYFGQTRRRVEIEFTPELRQEVRDCLKEMHDLYRRGHTPKVKQTKSCNACSLKDICLPKLSRTIPVHTYIRRSMEEKE